MSTEDQKRTEEYARIVADQVAVLETLETVDVRDPDELAELDGSTLLALVELVDFDATPAMLQRGGSVAFDDLAAHVEDYLEDHGGSVVEAWLEGVLDIEATYRRSLGVTSDDGPDSIAVLVTVGGPDARVYLDDIDGSARVEVRWWGSSARRHVHAPALAQRVYDLEEMMREATR